MADNDDFYEQLRLQQLCQEREAAGGLDPLTYKDPSDGTEYEWDMDKKAWFPKITDDFLAMYHANYGIHTENADDSTTANESTKAQKSGTSKGPKDAEIPMKEKIQTEAAEQKGKGEKRKQDQGWFNVEDQRNTNVYVTGLPLDLTNDEFVQIMSKCGIIMRDPMTEEYKVKLYKDKQGNLKGDGLCCYLKKESVGLALKLLDDYEIRGYRLHVECATFELKGEYDATKKRKKSKDYRKKLSMQQKQLDWRPEKKAEVRKRFERVIIIKNMFHPSDFEEDPLVLNEIREDLRSECEKFGQVKKVLIFDRHPDGVASVAFREVEESDMCIQTLNGRWFGGRQLVVEAWDGVTDYQIEETSREREERLKGWDTFLHLGKTEGTSDKNSNPTNEVESDKKTNEDTGSTNNKDSNGDQPENDKADPAEDDAESTDSSIGSSDEDDTDKGHL
ncbi:HIV Tat-specific factor 1 [Pelobates cultripes]|uniref:17S U2 SnRNP complex component HTATSF1 n=1 Tax=Pelobates cultripes TaxID=61616 RepID=A0AAD1WNM1_PELCU|nr:HIV Tat-specific factor 1 [Pelobates cultripes]